MVKAILVMNMPENCFKCKLQNWLNCRIKNKCHVGGCRPDWCPLRELPEKKETVYPQECYDNSYWSDEMRAGWNACLDMILEKKVNENVMPGTRNEKRTEGAQENEKRK